jgi:hypothetical protein
LGWVGIFGWRILQRRQADERYRRDEQWPKYPTLKSRSVGHPTKCFAQLKYRQVEDLRAELAFGRTHSFWYVQGSTAVQYILSGGPVPPSGPNSRLNVGASEDIHGGVDNVSAAVSWDSGLSPENWRVGQPVNLNFRVPAPSRFSKGLGLNSPILESTVTPRISTGGSASAF